MNSHEESVDFRVPERYPCFMGAKYIELATVLHKQPALLEMILEDNEDLVCRKKDAKRTKKLPIRALYKNNPEFWKDDAQGTKGWQFFITAEIAGEYLKRYRESQETDFPEYGPADGSGADSAAASGDADSDLPILSAADDTPPHSRAGHETNRSSNTASPDANYGHEYSEAKSLDVDQRNQWLAENLARIESVNLENVEERLEVLTDTTVSTTMINKATMDEALSMDDAEAKEMTQEIVNNTQRFILKGSRLMMQNVERQELFKQLVSRSNGTVVQHMTRVFITGFSFLLFYNNLTRHSGIASRTRIRFRKEYQELYTNLLPDVTADAMSLERVFKGGMQTVSNQELMSYATGFLLHDIGKTDDIEYHEGEEEYDREKVVRHVNRGYKAITTKSRYPKDVALITGFHHEYYGHPSGYGYFRALLDRYKKLNPKAKVEFAIAYHAEEVIDYSSLAFFPAKIMEIIDVFDSLTDKNRKYRKPLSQDEALEFMRQEFIRNEMKLDPILFDLFVTYIEAGDSKETERGGT